MDLNKLDFPYFKSVRVISDKDDGIAKSKRSTGELVINLVWWPNLKIEHKIFVLFHEEGHIKLNTRDEFKADEYASKKYFDLGLSEVESIMALTKNLKKEVPVHNARAWLQYQRSLRHSKKKQPYYDDNINNVKQELLNNVFNL